MSLFGSQSRPSFFPPINTGNAASTQQQQPSNSLFGGSSSTQTNTNANQNQTSSLFGSSLQPQQQQQQQQSSGGLFGASTSQPQQSGGLFGSTTSQPQPQQSGGLFGSLNTQQQQQPSGGLFGATATQQPAQQQSSLFGSQQAQPQQSSLFGGSQQQQQQPGGLFGSTAAQQPQQQQPLGGASLGMSSQQQSQFQNNRSLWQPGSSITPRQKSIPEQMQTLVEKWSPDSPACLFQTYFYNKVSDTTAPFYGPSPGEDEQKWEEALSNKRDENTIPVLCKGFSALGNRLRVQVQSVAVLQARLHEINNSLTAILQKHDVELTVRTADAKRRHTALSRRCLTLATKIQILRNRGYAMDSAEEDFKKRLLELEKSTFDPALTARREEIWAKMLSIRDRTRLLTEETEKIAGKAAAGTGGGQGEGDAIDEEVLKATQKILGDFSSQIAHLQNELEQVRKDFEDWDGGNPRR